MMPSIAPSYRLMNHHKRFNILLGRGPTLPGGFIGWGVFIFLALIFLGFFVFGSHNISLWFKYTTRSLYQISPTEIKQVESGVDVH